MKRSLLKKLISWKESPDRKPLLLKGVRQVGKTHLLKDFGNHYFKQLHYFNFEKQEELSRIFEDDLDPYRILDQLSFLAEKKIKIGEDLVIFDEIQEVARALTSLKYFQEEMPGLHLCAAGSLLGLHLNSTSFPVGKVTFETLRPMTYGEFLEAGDDKALPYLQNFDFKKPLPLLIHEHLWEQFKIYLIVGGLPEVVLTYHQNKHDLTEVFSKVRKKQDDLLQSYYADIAKHSGKINAMHIGRVFQAVPSQLSHAQDTSVSRFKFKGVVPGVTHYDRLVGAIDWLESSGMVMKIPILNVAKIPFSGYTKENIFKMMLFDVGMLGAMTHLSPKQILEYDYGSYKGYVAENYVAQELLASMHHAPCSWHEGTSEIEFLLEKEGNIIPIEVKSGNLTKAKSLSVFSEKYHPPIKIICSGKNLGVDQKGISYCPLYLVGSILKLI